MAREPRDKADAPDDPLDAAAKRLERAVVLLGARFEQVKKEARQSAGSLFDFDRNKLADDLDAAQAKKAELEEAGREASAALGRAIEEIRVVMQKAEA